MSDRSGSAEVELAVLDAVAVATSDRPQAYVPCVKALAAIEERIGLGPRYACELLFDSGSPWVIPVRTLAAAGRDPAARHRTDHEPRAPGIRAGVMLHDQCSGLFAALLLISRNTEAGGTGCPFIWKAVPVSRTIPRVGGSTCRPLARQISPGRARCPAAVARHPCR